ncbi:MAG TPA: LysR family transcriptional regulator [Sphingomonadaceae bacterium]|nr:LysR family transcriptional regulator [Sphingomonadaceae bacterium]
MTFDIRQLRAFLAVVDKGSLGRAAPSIFLTQSALSRVIADMEQRAGQRLFERHSKGMMLTGAGEALLPHVRLLLFELEQAMEALDSVGGLRRGVVRVGAVATITRTILNTALATLTQTAPGLRVKLLEAPEDRLTAALVGREIDLMIGAEIPPHAEIMRLAECRFDDVFSVFCAADHPLAGGGPVGLDDVLSEHWVMPGPGATPRALFEAAVREAGREPPVVAIETHALGAMQSLVAESRLLGWLPRPVLARDEAAGVIVVLDIDALRLRRQFYVYRRRAGPLPPAAQQLMTLLPLRGGDG